jgi:DNA invertase Pin-like site-specific DNA recombinase
MNANDECAVLFRVSTSGQDLDVQRPAVERLVSHRGWSVVAEYMITDSASHPGMTYRDGMARILADAHAGRWRYLVTFAADRVSREGIEVLLGFVRQLGERGCSLVSVSEPWLSGDPHSAELLLAIAGWLAAQESRRKSERARADVEKRRAAGLPVGRLPGATDKRKRRTAGYGIEQERRKRLRSA